MSTTSPCPACASPYGYSDGTRLNCPECGHAWEGEEAETEAEAADDAVRDANGNVLLDGDSVVVIKDLPVKGAPKPVKAGTKVKNIRLVDGDHNISCKIDGFGAMGLKSEFVRKA
jgi:protein PhnA